MTKKAVEEMTEKAEENSKKAEENTKQLIGELQQEVTKQLDEKVNSILVLLNDQK